MAGIDAINSFEPSEIRGVGGGDFIVLPCTIEKGNLLQAGTLIGLVPTSGRYGPYDDDGGATATSPAAGDGNTGNGTVSEVEVQDDYTLTEDWTLLCTAESENGGTFSVTGSLSGNAGNAVVGSQFRYPDSAAYKVRFTISDSTEDFDEGDEFTFSTNASKAKTALGILSEDVDASDSDQVSAMYVRGCFRASELTGMDSNALADLNGKLVNNLFIM